MQIINYGHFQQYQDGPYLLYRNEEGKDWNQMQKGDLETPPLVVMGPQGQFLSSRHPSWVMVSTAGVITNVEFDPSRMVPHDKTILGTDAEISSIKVGMIFREGKISDAPAPTLEEIRVSAASITRRQLRLTLVRNGVSLASVSDAIDSMPEGLEREEMRIEWDDGTTFERLNPRLNAIADVLGLTQEQVDDMWKEAQIA